MYDLFGKEFIQLKARDNPNMSYYTTRSHVPYDDGVYLAPDGIVIIKNGVFKCTLRLDQIFDKWGARFDLSKTLANRNPLYKIAKAIQKKYKNKTTKKRKRKTR